MLTANEEQKHELPQSHPGSFYASLRYLRQLIEVRAAQRTKLNQSENLDWQGPQEDGIRCSKPIIYTFTIFERELHQALCTRSLSDVVQSLLSDESNELGELLLDSVSLEQVERAYRIVLLRLATKQWVLTPGDLSNVWPAWIKALECEITGDSDLNPLKIHFSAKQSAQSIYPDWYVTDALEVMIADDQLIDKARWGEVGSTDPMLTRVGDIASGAVIVGCVLDVFVTHCIHFQKQLRTALSETNSNKLTVAHCIQFENSEGLCKLMSEQGDILGLSNGDGIAQFIRGLLDKHYFGLSVDEYEGRVPKSSLESYFPYIDTGFVLSVLEHAQEQFGIDASAIINSIRCFLQSCGQAALEVGGANNTTQQTPQGAPAIHFGDFTTAFGPMAVGAKSYSQKSSTTAIGRFFGYPQQAFSSECSRTFTRTRNALMTGILCSAITYANVECLTIAGIAGGIGLLLYCLGACLYGCCVQGVSMQEMSHCP